MFGKHLAIGALDSVPLRGRLLALLAARSRPDERTQILGEKIVGGYVRLHQRPLLPHIHRHHAPQVATSHFAGHIAQPPLGSVTIEVADYAVGRAWRQRDPGNREQVRRVVATHIHLQVNTLELHRIGDGSRRLSLQIAERQVDIERIRLFRFAKLFPIAAEESDRERAFLAARLAGDLDLCTDRRR